MAMKKGKMQKKSFSSIPDKLLVSDLAAESVGGGTNASAALGNGSLTVGISPWAELIYFRWPHLSISDQLRYFTRRYGVLSNFAPQDVRWGPDAPCYDWFRYGRPREPVPGLGAKFCVGLSNGSTFFLDDPVWKSFREYSPTDGGVLTTSLKSEQVSVSISQAVHPTVDLLIQQISSADGSNSAKWFGFYGCFNPRIGGEFGMGKADPVSAGFCCVFLQKENSILWFLPKQKNKGILKRWVKNNGIENLSSKAIDKLYPESGIFIALSTDQPIEEFQIGKDMCRKNCKEQGARYDLMDGVLNKNKIIFGKSNSGVLIKQNPANVYISISDHAENAVEIVKGAFQKGYRQLIEETNAWWKEKARKIEIPSSATDLESQIARRMILNLFMGQDKKTGGIVASPSRQPHYNCDWPRDGAFYDCALDFAGFHDTVDNHLQFYRTMQRKNKIAFSPTWLLSLKSPIYNPSGHWFSNMWTQGKAGWFKMVPIEIDETSLIVWDIWRHEKYISEESRKVAYRDQFKPVLELALDGIMRFVDVKKGWSKRVMEDDDFVAKSTLHGVSAIFSALCAGYDLGLRWNLPKKKLQKIKLAAVNMRQGILKRIEPKKIDKIGWRGLQWSLFPAPVFDKNYSDPKAEIILKKLAEEIREKAFKVRRGFAYLAEQLFTFAIATAKYPEAHEYTKLKKDVLKIIAEEVAMPGTHTFGEVVLWIEDAYNPGTYFAQNRTSIPHLWTGVTFYLAVQAVYNPSIFFDAIPPVPK